MKLIDRLRQANRRRNNNARTRKVLAELESRHVVQRAHCEETPVIISLTSYPPRFQDLSKTLRCLLMQTVRPDRVILWIAKADLDQLPADVLSLVDQGLEIGKSEDLRSFKKIIPALAAYPEATIITADDDVHYRAEWLEELLAAASSEKVLVAANRARKWNRAQPYSDWPLLENGPEQGQHVFPTGVEGILYRPGALHDQATNIETAMRLCPTGDDIWLYWMHQMAGGAALTLGRPQRIVPWRKEANQLQDTNVAKGGNDEQINAMIKHFGLPH